MVNYERVSILPPYLEQFSFYSIPIMRDSYFKTNKIFIVEFFRIIGQKEVF